MDRKILNRSCVLCIHATSLKNTKSAARIRIERFFFLEKIRISSPTDKSAALTRKTNGKKHLRFTLFPL